MNTYLLRTQLEDTLYKYIHNRKKEVITTPL